MLIQVEKPAPILNTADFPFAFGGKNGKQIPLDAKGHPYCYEFVALKGTIFQVLETYPRDSYSIHKVICSFYPSDSIYIDSRFTKVPNAPFYPILPSKQTILRGMENLTGMSYVWGGNWSLGIPELIEYFPPRESLEDKTLVYWTMKGVDCSGLLYETTGGATPRNTSQLINYGKGLKLKGLSTKTIMSSLLPLDMIIYPGHVLFVLNQKTSIESKYPFGVIQRNLEDRLEELFSERTLVDAWTKDPSKDIMIRRFFP